MTLFTYMEGPRLELIYLGADISLSKLKSLCVLKISRSRCGEWQAVTTVLISSCDMLPVRLKYHAYVKYVNQDRETVEAGVTLPLKTCAWEVRMWNFIQVTS
jgi:hypothetical protein